MRRLQFLNLVLLIGFGLVAGTAKILLVPAELKFIEYLGWPNWTLQALGALQVYGALNLWSSERRPRGALALLISFVLVTIIVALNGRLDLFVLSFIPTAMAAAALKISSRDRR